MKVKLNILIVLLLASAMSLSSCVNQVNPPKAQDTLSFLGITYNFLDTTSELTVTFHPSLKPPWKNTWKLNWDFGDSTGFFARNDTNSIVHIFKKSGSHSITLSVVDTAAKYTVGKRTILIGLESALTQLAIIYIVPDSDKILTGQFTAASIAGYQKNLSLDWNFGDNTGIISRFDTTGFLHSFKSFGTYTVTLKVIDTFTKIILGNTSITLDIKDNPIDTFFLHKFINVQITFSFDDTMGLFYHTCSAPNIQWNGNYFELKAYCNWQDSFNYWNTDNGTEGFTLSGHISYSGNKIDSGSLDYIYYFSYWNRGGPGGNDKGTILRYLSLPNQEKDSNKLKYSSTGSALQSIITQYRDSSQSWYDMTRQSNQFTKDMILWDQQPPPTLSVTFSK